MAESHPAQSAADVEVVRDTTQFHPRHDLVLVCPDENATMYGRIHIAATSQTYPTRGTVVAVGPGILRDDGSYLDIGLEVGARVEFTKDPNRPMVKHEGEQHFLMREGEIVAVLSHEPRAALPPMDGPPAQVIGVDGIKARPIR